MQRAVRRASHRQPKATSDLAIIGMTATGMILSFDNPNRSKGKPLQATCPVESTSTQAVEKESNERSRERHGRRDREMSHPARDAAGMSSARERNERCSERRGGQDVGKRKNQRRSERRSGQAVGK
jgi:hypothetical protein